MTRTLQSEWMSTWRGQRGQFAKCPSIPSGKRQTETLIMFYPNKLHVLH